MTDFGRFNPNTFSKLLMERRVEWLKTTTQAEAQVLKEMIQFRNSVLRQLDDLKDLTDDAKRLILSPTAENRLTELQQSLAAEIVERQNVMTKALQAGKAAGFERGVMDINMVMEQAGVSVNWMRTPDYAIHQAVSRSVLGMKPDGAYSGTTAEANLKVGQAVRQNLLSGQPLDETARQLRRDLNITAARAMRITRTNVNAAQNEGHVQAYADNQDIIAGYMWDAVFDSRTSAICATLHGQTVPIGGKFPGGFEAPPAHPNCRSTTLPVFKDEQANKEVQKAERRTKEEYITPEGRIKERPVLIDPAERYEKWLEKQPKITQENVLKSDYKYKMWKDKKIVLPDVLRDNLGVRSDVEIADLIARRAAGEVPIPRFNNFGGAYPTSLAGLNEEIDQITNWLDDPMSKGNPEYRASVQARLYQLRQRQAKRFKQMAADQPGTMKIRPPKAGLETPSVQSVSPVVPTIPSTSKPVPTVSAPPLEVPVTPVPPVAAEIAAPPLMTPLPASIKTIKKYKVPAAMKKIKSEWAALNHKELRAMTIDELSNAVENVDNMLINAAIGPQHKNHLLIFRKQYVAKWKQLRAAKGLISNVDKAAADQLVKKIAEDIQGLKTQFDPVAADHQLWNIKFKIGAVVMLPEQTDMLTAMRDELSDLVAKNQQAGKIGKQAIAAVAAKTKVKKAITAVPTTPTAQSTAVATAAKKIKPLRLKKDQVNDWAEKQFKGLTVAESEHRALRRYQGSRYVDINTDLRKGRLQRDVRKWVKDIDAVFKKPQAVLSDSVEVSRGVRDLKFLGGIAPPNAVGRVILERGYSSTTMMAESVAFGGHQLVITVPKGMRGLYLSAASKLDIGEYELLLPRNTRFKIMSVETIGKMWDKSPKYSFHLEVVAQE